MVRDYHYPCTFVISKGLANTSPAFKAFWEELLGKDFLGGSSRGRKG